jgi:hypothetical protein
MYGNPRHNNAFYKISQPKCFLFYDLMTCSGRNTQASQKGHEFSSSFISCSLRSCGRSLNPQGIRLRVKGLCALLIKHITVLLCLACSCGYILSTRKEIQWLTIVFYSHYSTFWDLGFWDPRVGCSRSRLRPYVCLSPCHFGWGLTRAWRSKEHVLYFEENLLTFW